MPTRSPETRRKWTRNRLHVGKFELHRRSEQNENSKRFSQSSSHCVFSLKFVRFWPFNAGCYGKMVRTIRISPRTVRLIRKKRVCFPIYDVRAWRGVRINRVYVLSRVRNNRVSLYFIDTCFCSRPFERTSRKVFPYDSKELPFEFGQF